MTTSHDEEFIDTSGHVVERETGEDETTDESVNIEEDARYRRAKELRENGVRVREICRRSGISMTTYYQWFPSSEATALQQQTMEIVRDIKIKREVLGWTDTAIAQHYKRTRQWVWSIAGPRSHPSPTEMIVVKWRASAQDVHAVEKVARRAGATYQDRDVTISALLDMIARGQLIVTAPRAKRKRGEANTDDSQPEQP